MKLANERQDLEVKANALEQEIDSLSTASYISSSDSPSTRKEPSSRDFNWTGENDRDVSTNQVRQMTLARSTMNHLWQVLGTSKDDITTFMLNVEELTPYSPASLKILQKEEQRLGLMARSQVK